MYPRSIYALVLSLGLLGNNAHAQTFDVLHKFSGAEGALPHTNVVVDRSGAVYGEASEGGVECPADTQSTGCGTVFRTGPSGATTPLVTFSGPNGQFAYADVTLHAKRLYGAATGLLNGDDRGLIFHVHTDGSNYSVMHRFDGNDGAAPMDRPIVMQDGTVFGTATQQGPACLNGASTCGGVLFKMTPSGVYLVLHAFSGQGEGYRPGRIAMRADGTIFGTTLRGGTQDDGTIFSYDSSTGAFLTVANFRRKVNGANPYLGGIAADGTIFGATSGGGTVGHGTLFKLVRAGRRFTLSTIWSFNGTDGGAPASGPLVAHDGTLTGTTTQVDGGYGTLYRFTPAGQMTVLYAFISTVNKDPAFPYGTPAIGPDGSIYGSAELGGKTCGINASTCGVVYRVIP